MTFTEIGAVIGTLAGAFVLFDRMVFGRPLVSLGRSGRAGFRDLNITNTSKVDVIIKRIRVTPKRVCVLPDDSTDGAAHSYAPFSALIEPGGKVAFPVVADGRLLENGAPHAPFFFVISWRKTTSMWLPQAPALVFSSAWALRAIDRAR
jgi:hypothetical protein